MSQTDFRKYSSLIGRKEDQPLIDEAIICAENGALRASYILVWLSCAESLKSRFQEASLRDSHAGVALGKIEKAEQSHKAIDSLLLDLAKNYGIISETEHQELVHLLTCRNLFAHPYQQAPTKEQLLCAFDVAIRCILSKQLRFKEGYAQTILDQLTKTRLYLDDDLTSIDRFTNRLLGLLDPSIYAWFLRKYIPQVELFFDDPTMRLFFQRGHRIIATLVTRNPNVFTSSEWHDLVLHFPHTLGPIAADSQVFPFIGDNAQDSLIGTILEHENSRRNLGHLEALYEMGLLSKRQTNRFFDFINRATFETVKFLPLSLIVLTGKIIRGLSSLDWYQQNPAVECLRLRTDQIDRLSQLDQDKLGRNVLQAADGGAHRAESFLSQIAAAPHTFPNPFLLGIVAELFVNEQGQFRGKLKMCACVSKLLQNLCPSSRCEILKKTSCQIERSHTKNIACDPISVHAVDSYLQSVDWPSDISLPLQRAADITGRILIQSRPDDMPEPSTIHGFPNE